MLRIYDVMIRVIAELKCVLVMIEAHDRDLARQLRRAAASVALNIGEGSGCSGGTRRQRYKDALGSAREVGACLDVAEAFGYGVVAQSVRDGLRQVQATLVRVIV